MLGGKAERDREFTAFVNAAMPELARIAWYLTGDVHGANELVQAALVKTYVAWPKVRQDKAVGYTRRVMVNHETDQWRRTRREVLVSQHHEALHETGQVDHAGLIDTTDALVSVLTTLPQQQRRVVVLRYYCDLSERQFANELGISIGAVKSAASRGLKALREHIQKAEEWTR